MKQTGTYFILITVMFIWGMNVVAVKFLVEHFDPVMMQGLRIGTAGLAALIVLYFLKDLRKVTRTELIFIIAGALFGQVAHHSLLAVGLQYTTASNGSLILGLIPITTAVLAMIFLNENVTKSRFTGILLGFGGVALVVINPGDPAGAVSSGDLLVFLSMFAQAISFIIIRKVTGTLSSRQLTAMMLLIGSISLVGISFAVEPVTAEPFLTAGTLVWSVFFSSAILATGMGHILFNAAIQKIGAGKSAVFNNLVPFFALIGSFFFLGEQIYLTQIGGFILIVFGVLLGTGYIEQQYLRTKKYSPQ
ncbi:DMT family transporter [Salisediminibacterium halotolerans]|uniref:DMT family transporter n=1 Tax=Salisediminibacterium halotolerans TaxID=517425 RepID=UPI000EAF5737|nr:DMT family transporter [Salisediminibacterium halotolerans]RLJ81052.1 drug/metabolite transporter (DMT)-like permease [Actinophytocola xinjiangensis]RPE87858.1 drug/metabolite transporter (DMT)-like permease [Salisediminibacterium halotolerans]TWG37945.1 drug/metabolite transporter (DMT)-like permease [Salisediminibacterium halotolerans]GEL08828.1 hypothetical protein SHA02_22440 [Salisediminibacterium halotolerans]